jgi:hypothetical protein
MTFVKVDASRRNLRYIQYRAIIGMNSIVCMNKQHAANRTRLKSLLELIYIYVCVCVNAQYRC